MRKSRFSDEQIVGILNEHAAGEATSALCRRHGISQQTFYRWKQKYDGLEADLAIKWLTPVGNNGGRRGH